MPNHRVIWLILLLAPVSVVAAGPGVVLESSNLPILLIDTGGQEILNEPGITAALRIVDNGPGQRNAVDDPANGYDGLVNIELRGWSSLYYYPKDSYSLETQNAVGESEDASLLGMPAEDDWVLYAPYGDKSLMRNALVYRLARDMGWWAPRTRFCEVVLNGAYMGVFVLMEKVAQDADRIDLDAPEPGRDDCGFLAVMTPEFQIEPGDVAVETPLSGRRWVIKYPRDEDLTAGRVAYVAGRLQALDAAFLDGDPEAWRPLLDAASFADVLLLNEFTRNYDAFAASTYVHGGPGVPLHLGPVWDYNITLGNINYPPEESDWETGGWTQDNVLWAEDLMADAGFAGSLSRDWSRRRLDVLDQARLDDWFDEHLDLLDESQARNFVRWPILGVPVWPNHFVGETWREEVAWLRQWVADRVDWIDGQWRIVLPPDPIVNEINYNSSDDFDPGDWVEIYNPGLDALDLGGWTFRDGDYRHAYALPAGTRLAPGGHLVLCRDPSAFSAAFPGVPTAGGGFDFGLSGGGEPVRLYDADGLLADHVTYDDVAPWPTAPDGGGPTLELRSPRYDNARHDSWAASTGHGTPGAPNGAFDDTVWLLTFTASRGGAGVELRWSVLGDGSDLVLMAEDADGERVVPHIDEGGGLYSALDTTPDWDDQVVYTLYHAPPEGETIRLGDRVLDEAAAVTRLVSTAPNPFDEELTITLELATAQSVRLVVYDLAGRRVAELLDERRGAGPVVVTWTPRRLASGVYIVCLECEAGRYARKITRVR